MNDCNIVLERVRVEIRVQIVSRRGQGFAIWIFAFETVGSEYHCEKFGTKLKGWYGAIIEKILLVYASS